MTWPTITYSEALEKLTAERDALKAELTALDACSTRDINALAQVQAENEQLRLELAAANRAVGNNVRENERLRVESVSWQNANNEAELMHASEKDRRHLAEKRMQAMGTQLTELREAAKAHCEQLRQLEETAADRRHEGIFEFEVQSVREAFEAVLAKVRS